MFRVNKQTNKLGFTKVSHPSFHFDNNNHYTLYYDLEQLLLVIM